MSAILPIRPGPQIHMGSQEPKSSQSMVRDLINLKLIEASRKEQEKIIEAIQHSVSAKEGSSQQQWTVVPAKGLEPNSQQQSSIT